MLSSQFTDTIRANFDNFNSKLSIPINIKNYDDINISKVENYYCNGNSLTFQPNIYNYKIAYWRVVKSIEIEISGQADDYAQVIVNNSITVHPNLQDVLGIKDGIYIWGKTQSSDYVKEKHPFTMTNENLNIQFGTVNTLPTVCYLKASLKIRLFFQFTGTINVSAQMISLITTLPINLLSYKKGTIYITYFGNYLLYGGLLCGGVIGAGGIGSGIQITISGINSSQPFVNTSITNISYSKKDNSCYYSNNNYFWSKGLSLGVTVYWIAKIKNKIVDSGSTYIPYNNNMPSSISSSVCVNP